MKWANICGLLAIVTGASVAEAEGRAAPNADYSLVFDNVTLRDRVKADIEVKVFVDERKGCRETLFAIHGLAHTASTFGPFAQAMFDDNSQVTQACRVAAINLPARGRSSLPTGDLYGNLSLSDYANAIVEVLDRLQHTHLKIHTVLGHSQGSLLLQAVQQQLIDDQTNMKKRWGIDRATLLAANGSVELAAPDDGSFAAFAAAFTTTDSILGTTLQVSDGTFSELFFSNFESAPAPGTPSTLELATLRYNAPAAGKATAELLYILPLAPPSASAGIFDARRHKTRLQVISASQDVFVSQASSNSIYVHLTGDDNLERAFHYVDEFAVHDTYITNPAGLIHALATAGKIRF